MGYSLAWLAVRGIPFEVTLDRLRLLPSGAQAEYAESDLSARTIAGNWTLVVARRCDHRIIAERELTTLSADCEVIACSVEEHVMYSSAELWSHGHRRWHVAHDAQKGIAHLSTSGDLPGDFAATRARFAQEQEAEGGAEADVDLYFEIPLTLAHARVGFKHDEAGESTEGGFQVLTDSVAPSRGPWWRFWR
jgi:hypothetical protein